MRARPLKMTPEPVSWVFCAISPVFTIYGLLSHVSLKLCWISLLTIPWIFSRAVSWSGHPLRLLVSNRLWALVRSYSDSTLYAIYSDSIPHKICRTAAAVKFNLLILCALLHQVLGTTNIIYIFNFPVRYNNIASELSISSTSSPSHHVRKPQPLHYLFLHLFAFMESLVQIAGTVGYR